MVEASLEAIGAGRLEKVVPARRVDLELAGAADPVAVLSRLRRGAPATLPFLLEPRPDAAWVGAAPEIVAACRDGRFHATAVAGTAPDAPDPGERSRLARELLESAKDRAEHAIGVRDMRRALLRLAEVAEVDEEPRVLRLRGMQHLLTNLSARVPEGLHVLDALAEMHPTAAVNGAPRAEALRFLRATEPFHRGWYAGPVGWFDAEGDGEFAPALRSVLIRGRRAHLFAGAGVVEGSEPDREWDETGWKLRPGLEGLGLDPDRLRGDGRDAAEPGTRAGSGAAG
jgi:isochorismate synthase